MGRLFDEAQKYVSTKTARVLLDMLANIEANNVDFESEGKAQLLKKIDEIIDPNMRPEPSSAKAWDFSKEKSCEIFAADNGLKLRPMHESDANFYFRIRSQWTNFFAQENSKEMWTQVMPKELSQEKSLFCAIVRESDGVAMGYVSLKDTTKELWELAIELDVQYCNQGYGPSAILLFLKRVKEVTGRSEFQILIEPDNTRCQKCMAKIGAEFIGIYNCTFSDPDDAIGFEEEHLDFLDDQLIGLAQRIGVEPRKLLSHVLNYQILITT